MAFTLRQETASGFTTKGSALSYAEGDNNFIGLYNRDDLRLPLSGGTLTGALTISSGNFNVASGQILSGGTDIATLWGGGGGGATVLDDLTDVSILGSGVNWSFYKNGSSPDGAPNTGTFSGNRNVALSPYALWNTSSGSDNISMGYQSQFTLTTGQNNIAIGSNALRQNSTGSNNIGIGRFASYSVTGTGNIGLGQQALFSCTGDYNLSLGYNSSVGTVITSGDRNITIGYGSTVNDGTADFQFSVGSGWGSGGDYLMSGDFGTVGGAKLGINLGKTGTAALNRPPNQPTATLHVKGQGTTTSTTSLLVVDSAGSSLIRLNDDGQGISIGHDAGGAGGANIGGNICIGKAAMEANGTGFDNVYIGTSSGFVGNAGWRNVALGASALRGKSGNYTFYSTAIGYYSMYDSTSTGAYTGANTALGAVAGKAITSGVNNLCLGTAAGYNLTTGSNNIYIGSATGGINSSIIPTGYVAASSASVSNELNIGNTVRADMSAGELFLSCPSAAPADADLNNNECSFFVDTGVFKVKYKDNGGVVTTFTLS